MSCPSQVDGAPTPMSALYGGCVNNPQPISGFLRGVMSLVRT